MRKLILFVVVAVVALGAGAYWYLNRDDAPAKVSLDAATKSVTGDGSSTTIAGAQGLDGTWTLDTSQGSFSFDSATGTFAGFRIKEQLASIGAATAVGRTGDVTGTMTIADDTVTKADLTVQLGTITTNDNRRDDRVRQALETGQFPTATFSLTQPIPLGADAANGQPVTVGATGDLTVHGVTKRVTFPLQAKLVGSTIVVVGSVDVSLADFGVQKPTAPIVLSVADGATIELQMLFTRA